MGCFFFWYVTYCRFLEWTFFEIIKSVLTSLNSSCTFSHHTGYTCMHISGEHLTKYGHSFVLIMMISLQSIYFIFFNIYSLLAYWTIVWSPWTQRRKPRALCNKRYPLEAHFNSNPVKSRLSITSISVVLSFWIFSRARQWCCRAVCKISKRFGSCEISYGQTLFHEISWDLGSLECNTHVRV